MSVGPAAVKLEDIFSQIRTVPAKAQIACAEAAPSIIYVHAGLCVGYDLLSDGRRQILAIYCAGDLINATALGGAKAAGNILAMSEAMIASLSPGELSGAMRTNPKVDGAIIRQMGRRQAILEAWIGALGRRSALERMAMLFCELAVRIRGGEPVNGSLAVPLSQADLADVLGLSVVHVNRVLRIMRESALASFEAGRLDILDCDRLAAIAEFDGAYLR